MAGYDVVVFLLLILGFGGVRSLPEQGAWTFHMNQDEPMIGVTKSMYKDSIIAVKIDCDGKNEVNIGWALRETKCAEEYIGIEEQTERINSYYQMPNLNPIGFKYKTVYYKKGNSYDNKCDAVIHLKEDTKEPRHSPVHYLQPEPASEKDAGASASPQDDAEDDNKKGAGKDKGSRTKREAKGKSDDVKNQETVEVTTPSTLDIQAAALLENATSPANEIGGIDHNAVTVTKIWDDGVYLFVIFIQPVGQEKFNATVNIWMKGKHGYLSAIEWPLLPFYATMCVIYVIYGLIWLALTFCNWRDLLRIQFWIGGVIVLGMLEKAVFFGEYESINSTGNSVRGAVVFAELVSCMKRTLARMLVVIVSLGFGIVKPRLGPMLHRVLGMGALYFILGSTEGCLRVLRPKGDPSNQALLASIPLAVLDAAICWWVFTSLVQTTRTLRLRRNVVKLSLYRHFTNTLIFAVLASVAFMIWSIKQHKLTSCLSDWKEIWVDDAFWHLLFSVILMVIMVLWRPTNNNQRYAFSPLLDAADDDMDDDEPTMMNDAFADSKEKLKERKIEDGMKMRGSKSQSNGSPKQKDFKSKTEDDLKWIEENIPTSVTDTALPSLLDSDEEIMTTKFEMSKME